MQLHFLLACCQILTLGTHIRANKNNNIYINSLINLK
jgi:hypothetical protein